MVASFQPLLSGTWHDIGYCLFGDDTTSTFDPSPPVPPFIPKINNKGIPLYSGVIRKQNIRHPSLSGRCSKLQGTQSSGNIRRHSGGIGSPQSLPEGQKYWKDRTGMGYGGITIPELANHQTKIVKFSGIHRVHHQQMDHYTPSLVTDVEGIQRSRPVFEASKVRTARGG